MYKNVKRTKRNISYYIINNETKINTNDKQ